MYLIIDGSSMLTTNYFGTLPRELVFAKTEEAKVALYPKIMQTSDGKYTNAVYTSLKQIFKMIQQQRPEGIVVVLDCTRNTFRREIYSEYKAQRSKTPAPLDEQFNTFAEVLSAIGIPVFYSNKYEADDLAGAIAKRLENAGKQCVLISGDKDYYQLVTSQTSLWRIVPGHAKKKYEKVYGINFNQYTSDNNLPTGIFETKLGDKIMIEDSLANLSPEQFVDYLAVAGDKADNIPGVHGVGSMTIIPLIQKYGSLDEIYKIIEEAEGNGESKQLATQWKTELGIKSSPINALLKNKQNAYLSQLLAKIKVDVDELPDNIHQYDLAIDRSNLDKVLQDYEFVSLKNMI